MKSQRLKVISILNEYGVVDRNHCIRQLYITRLSAIIKNLKDEGWVFMPKQTFKPNNYYYKLISKPNPQKSLI